MSGPAIYLKTIFPRNTLYSIITLNILKKERDYTNLLRQAVRRTYKMKLE